jgi:hypothetical protein
VAQIPAQTSKNKTKRDALEQFRVIPLGADLWQTMWRRPGADLLVTQNPLLGALGSHPVNLFTMILCRTSAPTWAVLRFQLRRVVAEVLPGSPRTATEWRRPALPSRQQQAHWTLLGGGCRERCAGRARSPSPAAAGRRQGEDRGNAEQKQLAQTSAQTTPKRYKNRWRRPWRRPKNNPSKKPEAYQQKIRKPL